MSLLVGRCLPWRRRERRRQLQPPLSKGQPSHATLTQSSCECRSQDQRKYLRDRVSTLGPAIGTQSSHRSHCPSTVSTDLADPAPRSPLRGTRPGSHQTVEATAHLEDDPATPNPRLSHRTTESSTKPSASAVIFDPDFRPWSSSSIRLRSRVTVTSLKFCDPTYLNLSAPFQLLLPASRVASVALATSFNKRSRQFAPFVRQNRWLMSEMAAILRQPSDYPARMSPSGMMAFWRVCPEVTCGPARSDDTIAP